MKKLLNLIPESLIPTNGNQTDFKKLEIFEYSANPLGERLFEDRNKFSARFEHKYIYKVLKTPSASTTAATATASVIANTTFTTNNITSQNEYPFLLSESQADIIMKNPEELVEKPDQ